MSRGVRLEKANLSPSFVDGGILPDINTNAQCKNGEHFVAELDESDGTLVKYTPNILVINNLEEDHLDYFKNGMQDLVTTFNISIEKSKKVIVNNDDSGIQMLKGDFITFGLNNADYIAKNIVYTKSSTKFDVIFKGEFLTDIEIQLVGKYNVYNALAVVSALNEANINVDELKQYFKEFTGMGRRFQKIAEINGITVYDDYAHHPTEIKSILEAAALKFGKENIVAVFQPHRYTRLQGLWNEFLGSFNNTNRVIVTDVFSASEIEIPGINGKNFANELTNSEHISGSIEEVAEKLFPTLKNGDIVIGLGAGTITNLGKYIEKAGSLVNQR